MNLDQYETQIEEIRKSDLSGAAKAAALRLTANEIRGALWQEWAKKRATEIAARASVLGAELETNPDDDTGLVELARGGLLRKKL